MQSKHTMSCILFKNLATGLPVLKTLIKYNNNSLEENDEKEKEPIDLEFVEQKADPYNDENSIDYKWSDVNEEEIKILLWQTSLRTCKSKLMKRFSIKKKLLNDCGIVPNEKKN